ncbi:hypothetical protein NPIL_258521, partial [Nephila pilipes]
MCHKQDSDNNTHQLDPFSETQIFVGNALKNNKFIITVTVTLLFRIVRDKNLKRTPIF